MKCISCQTGAEEHADESGCQAVDHGLSTEDFATFLQIAIAEKTPQLPPISFQE